MKKDIHGLIEYISESVTAFHATACAEKHLESAGFIQLKEPESWNLETGGKYYITRNGSAFIAFVVGSGKPEDTGFKIIGAHTDSPSLRLKPGAGVRGEGSTVLLNCEVYGGPILATWLDRTLSLAGKVVTKESNKIETELINIKDPLVQIPSVPIHLNKDVNKSLEINAQRDLQPLFAEDNGSDPQAILLSYISKQVKKPKESIVDYDLFLYDAQSPALTGLDQKFLSSSRIDNLQSVFAALCAITDLKVPEATSIIACFDNEEVGSSTPQGADSEMLASVCERISLALDGGREEYLRAKSRSFMLSADCAHAVHPVKSDKYDTVNKPVLNQGPVIKISASQSYTTSGETGAYFENLCDTVDVPVQRFVNRSDQRGGSTIGPLSSTHVDVQSVDVGIPILAMHAIREICGVEDHNYFVKVCSAFFSDKEG